MTNFSEVCTTISGRVYLDVATVCSQQLLYCIDRSNPFRVSDMSSEFFSCGFLDDTQIFVADSLVTEVRCT